jgi:ABC-type branched-subunit amino acid transport system substrate-binding protein
MVYRTDGLDIRPRTCFQIDYVVRDFCQHRAFELFVFGELEALEEAGLEVSGAFPYRIIDADYDRLASEIKRSGVDVLFVASYLEDAIAMRLAMLEQDVQLVASVGTSSSYCMHAFGEALGDDAVGLFASDKPDGEVLEASALSPEAAEALRWARKTYRERFDHEMTAPALSGFAATWALLRHVLPAADDLSAEAVARAALETKLPEGSLPNGSGLDLAPSGHREAGANLRATSVIWEWVEPGVRAIVWPPALATSEIRPLPIS